MILPDGRPPVNGGRGCASNMPDDPRVETFCDLVNAVDRTNPKASLQAVRELRRLGFSIVVIGPQTGGRR